MWSLRIFGGLGWKELGLRIIKEVGKDDVFGRAAQLAFYFLLALFPLLLFLTVLLGYAAESGTELRNRLLNYLSAVLPVSASDLIYTTVDDISKASSGGKLSFGVLAALWASSNGMSALIQSLNVAYNVEEARPWWKRRMVSIGLTIALAVLIISALTLLLIGEAIGETIAESFGLGYAFTTTWKIVQWPLVLAFALLSFDLAYYFAPNVKNQTWKWVTPGAIVGLSLWLLVSFALRGYLKFFNTYNVTYGSLGAVIILMLWFYFTGAAILIGGEVDSEIDAASKTQEHN